VDQLAKPKKDRKPKPKKEEKNTKGTTAVKYKAAAHGAHAAKPGTHSEHAAVHKHGTLHVQAPTSKGKAHRPHHMSRVFRGVEVAA